MAGGLTHPTTYREKVCYAVGELIGGRKIMSRVIKFRAFDKNNFMGTDEPTMFYIGNLPDGVSAFFDQDGLIYFLGEGMEDDVIGMQWVEIETSPLMQFTGLFDKSGKEIYEGDIMRNSETGEVVQVEWSRGRVCFELKPIGTWSWVGFEVIGNIHENPELLLGKGD